MVKQFLTPRTTSTAVRGVSFDIPASPDFVAIVRGLLQSMTDIDAWEQIPDITITPQQAVTLAISMLLSFEAGLNE